MLMPVGSTRGYYPSANFDKKVLRGNRDMGVLRLGGAAKMWVAPSGGISLRHVLVLEER